VEFDDVRSGFLGAGLPEGVVDEALEAYVEAKRRFYLGDHRPQAVEGGRFSEAVFRLAQHAVGLKMTPLGKTLPSLDKLVPNLESASGPDSVRLHIPRTLKLIYDIRNKRDTAHLGDGIDPNLQDATLVTNNMDWVMAELVRQFHGVLANEAQAIIQNLVSKDVPAVQEIDGQPVILADLKAADQALLMLYRAGAAGAEPDELAAWLRVTRKDHLKARLGKTRRQKTCLGPPVGALLHHRSWHSRSREEATPSARRLAVLAGQL
jgi:hypothetical protein